jgi:hypothetical protein
MLVSNDIQHPVPVTNSENGFMRTRPYIIDENGIESQMLGDTIYPGCLLSIPVEHHEIHCGDSYTAFYTGDLANGASIVFSIVVPNELQKLFHLVYIIDTEAEALIEVKKDTTLSNNGTPITIFNRNHNSTLVDYIGFNHTPTITGAGTLFYSKRIGSGRQSGGQVGRSDEIILKNNSKYTITITNATANNNYYNIELNYYVHPGV